MSDLTVMSKDVIERISEILGVDITKDDKVTITLQVGEPVILNRTHVILSHQALRIIPICTVNNAQKD